MNNLQRFKSKEGRIYIYICRAYMYAERPEWHNGEHVSDQTNSVIHHCRCRASFIKTGLVYACTGWCKSRLTVAITIYHLLQ